LTAAASASGSDGSASDAPLRNAASRLASLLAVAMTRAPISRPICTAAMPSPPLAPWTSRVSPGRSAARHSSAAQTVP